MSTRILHARALPARASRSFDRQDRDLQHADPLSRLSCRILGLCARCFRNNRLGYPSIHRGWADQISSWFCRTFTLTSTSDDARSGLCSPVRSTVPPSSPDGLVIGLMAYYEHRTDRAAV